MKQNEIKELICLVELILADKTNTISDHARKKLEKLLLKLREGKSEFSLLSYLDVICRVMTFIDLSSRLLELLEKYFS